MIWDQLFKKFLIVIELKNVLPSYALAVDAGVPLNQSLVHFLLFNSCTGDD